MTGDANAVLRAINYAIDAVFFCDLLLQFVLGFWDPALHAMCYDPWLIARRYAASWLAMDMVSIFPFEVAARGNEQLRSLRVVRIVRRSPRSLSCHARGRGAPRALLLVVTIDRSSRRGAARWPSHAAALLASSARPPPPHRRGGGPGAADQARAALAARADGRHARDQGAVHRADEVRAAHDLPDALGGHLLRAARSSCGWLEGGYALE